MGITAPAPVLLTGTNIAGHAMIEIPGGHTVIGSGAFEEAQPRWVSLSPYLIGEKATSESQYREVTERPGRKDSPEDHHATMVTYHGVMEYLEKRGGGLILPTEAQWENAARGPAVNIPEIMEVETGRFTPADIADFVKGRFENFVFEISGEIFIDPKAVQSFISEGGSFYGKSFFGWPVHATTSGRLTREGAWFGREGTAPVNWGPRNAYGLHNMTGNVHEWVQDWYAEDVYMLGGVDPMGPDKGDYKVLRGGSWYFDEARALRAAYRLHGPPGARRCSVGFRVAAPQAVKD